MKPTHKLLTSVFTGLLGVIGGIAATSYGIGVEKTKITQKDEEHDKKLIEIAALVHENSTSTNVAIVEINKAITGIQKDLAVLTALQQQRQLPQQQEEDPNPEHIANHK